MGAELGPINVAVIPAAGEGTRLRPASLAIPKEMLPIPNRGVWQPTIQVVVEEVGASGLRTAVIVKKPGKEAIKRHFVHPETGALRNIGEHSSLSTLHFVDQVEGMYGNGVPLLSVESYIQRETHVLTIWGDEFFATDGSKPRAAQMFDLFNRLGGNVGVISAVRIQAKQDLALYGIADVTESTPGVYRIRDMIEKPDPDKAPSNLAAHGAYLLPVEVVDILRVQQPGRGGEVWLTDAIRTLIMSNYPVYACEIQGADYCDAGTTLNYFRTIVKRGLNDPIIGSEVRALLESISNLNPTRATKRTAK